MFLLYHNLFPFNFKVSLDLKYHYKVKNRRQFSESFFSLFLNLLSRIFNAMSWFNSEISKPSATFKSRRSWVTSAITVIFFINHYHELIFEMYFKKKFFLYEISKFDTFWFGSFTNSFPSKANHFKPHVSFIFVLSS